MLIKNNKYKVIAIAFASAIIFICIYILNNYTYLGHDEYVFSFIYGTNSRIRSLYNIF